MTRNGSLRIEFAVTPRFDVFYALYTLTSSAHTPLETWKEKALRRLSRDFESVAKRVAPLPIFWPLLADAIQGVPGEVSFDELLSTIREMPDDDLKRNIFSGIFHDRKTVDALIDRKNALADFLTDETLPGAELLMHFGLKPYDHGSPAARAMSALLTRPQSYREELGLVLQRFWDSGFQQDWSALEAGLRAESFRMRDLQEERSAAALAHELNLPVAFDDGAREIRPRAGAAIAYDRIDRCYILPSAFNTRRLWTKYETAARRVTVYLPVARELEAANEIGAAAVRGQPRVHGKTATEINAESVFRALGDTTRYAIASILARTPTTSAELARSLKVSKPTITHHVHALRSAGLITGTPSRGSTKLSLSRDTVAALSGAAVEQLFTSTRDLTLGTTRKRRS
ncbi:MAG TPA: winged helix-turn-helix domain-containing protein [Gemmatimonadaceae bacterium]|nr:winged helix-turn-helix domain-containing protein [Gemmatimonadaceae bacterium]HZF72974.1 winged helix-turn-helix domain-containing protein [Gemmatimonadaceae bacterium]